MKILLKKVIWGLGICWSYLYIPPFRKILKNIHTLLYSAFISRDFGSFGVDAGVMYPGHFRGEKYIHIGDRVSIGKYAVITTWDAYENESFEPYIEIGEGTSIGDNCHISAISRIVFGKNVLTGRWLTVVDNSHGRIKPEELGISPIKRLLYSKGNIEIGDNVWIGDKVTILAGVTIGTNSIVGANSLVTADVPPNCVVGGIPAKIIKYI